MNRDWQRGLTVVLERHALFIQIHRKASMTCSRLFGTSLHPFQQGSISHRNISRQPQFLNTVISLKATLFYGMDCLVTIGWRLRSNRHQETSFTSVCNVSATNTLDCRWPSRSYRGEWSTLCDRISQAVLLNDFAPPAARYGLDWEMCYSGEKAVHKRSSVTVEE